MFALTQKSKILLSQVFSIFIFISLLTGCTKPDRPALPDNSSDVNLEYGEIFCVSEYAYDQGNDHFTDAMHNPNFPKEPMIASIIILSARYFYLKINSVPLGATVFINEKEYGKTPINLAVSTNYKSIELTFEKKGYIIKTLSFQPETRKNEVQITLSKVK